MRNQTLELISKLKETNPELLEDLEFIQEYIENENTNEEQEYFDLKMKYLQLKVELNQIAIIENMIQTTGTISIENIILKQNILKKHTPTNY